MKTSSENQNATIGKRNHKYIPLSNQGKNNSSSNDPSNMMISQNSTNFTQIHQSDPNDSANKYKQSKYVQQVK